MEYIRIGKVSSRNPTEGTVQVYFEDDDSISDDLFLQNRGYDMPEIDANVVCLFPNNERGICINSFYTSSDRPKENSSGKYIKEFGEFASITVDIKTGEMIIKSPLIKMIGNVEINGSLIVLENLKVTGSITSNGEEVLT